MKKRLLLCLRFVPIILMSVFFIWLYYGLTHSTYSGSGTASQDYHDFLAYLLNVEGLITLILCVLCSLSIKPRKWGILSAFGTYILLLILCTALWGKDYEPYVERDVTSNGFSHDENNVNPYSKSF